MENFNLALLSAPVSMKDMSSEIQAQPHKSSEKEFSGILVKEETRAGEVKNSAVNQKEPRKASVKRKADEARKAGSNAGDRPVKNESPDKTTENRDDDTQETGVNVFAAVPAECVNKENSAKVKQSTELAENLEIQALFAENSEAGTIQTTQIETPELPVIGDEISMLNEETFTAQNSLLTQGSGGNGDDGELLLSNSLAANESDSGALSEELAEGEHTTKPFSVNIIAESAAEKVVEKVTEKLPEPGSEIEFSVAETGVGKVTEKFPESGSKIRFAAAETGKKKIELVENPKTAAAQNVVSDISAAAATADTVAANSEKDGLHQARVVDRLSSHGGISMDELHDGVEVHVESEIIASDEKMQRKVNFSDRLAENRFHSGSETGTVHLQGRARENQPSLLQNGQGEKESTPFSEGENSRGKAVFMDDLKSSVSEKITAESLLQSGVKDKSALETNFSKSVSLADVNSDLSSAAVVKKGAVSMLSKPLPISDEHLLDQIQAGLTRPVNGRQTVTIKLWPEHLGRVDVKLVMNKQHLTATFTVDHSDVKDAMMRKVESLRDSLGLRGIDAKDISIKVAPAKSGDGTSLMTDSQQHDSNSAWRQFNQGNLANNNSGSQPGWDNNLNEDPLLAGTDIIESISSLTGDIIDAGSLHITA